MSTVWRLASGNAAGLTAVASNLLIQLAAVPIFLHRWTPAEYGLWLGLMTAVALVTIIDNGHLDYLGFECMKYSQLEIEVRSQILSDAFPALAFSAVIETTAFSLAMYLPQFPALFNLASNSPEISTIRLLIFALIIAWYVVQFSVQLFGRVLTSLGHYAEVTWWYALNLVAQTMAPATAALFGAHLRGATLAYVAATIAVQILCGIRYFSLARRYGLRLRTPDAIAGLRRLRNGAMLGAAAMVDFMQQAGFRLVLLPFLGAIRLVEFATMRTAANVVQQGMQILANPAIPELMRYVSNRDRLRTGIVMAAMFYITVVVMCPGFVALQAIAHPLFSAWTAGHVEFDRTSFVILSTSVLLSGLSQPARAVIRGNNLVGWQTAASVLTAAVLLVTTFVVAGRLGVLGVSLAVLAAEGLRLTFYLPLAARWFGRNDFSYPWRSTVTAVGCVAVTITTLGLMALLPGHEVRIAICYLPIWAVLNLLFWRSLSPAEQKLVRSTISRLVPKILQARTAG